MCFTWKLCGLALAGALFLAGCAARSDRAVKSSAAPSAVPASPTAPREIGKIVLVNEESRFVLIDAQVSAAPPVGIALMTFPAGAKPVESTETSVLTVSAERQLPFVAADIVRGTPAQGDAVFR